MPQPIFEEEQEELLEEALDYRIDLAIIDLRQTLGDASIELVMRDSSHPLQDRVKAILRALKENHWSDPWEMLVDQLTDLTEESAIKLYLSACECSERIRWGQEEWMAWLRTIDDPLLDEFDEEELMWDIASSPFIFSAEAQETVGAEGRWWWSSDWVDFFKQVLADPSHPFYSRLEELIKEAHLEELADGFTWLNSVGGNWAAGFKDAFEFRRSLAERLLEECLQQLRPHLRHRYERQVRDWEI